MFLLHRLAALSTAAVAAAAVAVASNNEKNSPITPVLPWPWAWDTLQPFAFPGAANRFMTPAEAEYFTSNFSMLLIWGLNTTCADGTPATCPDGKSVCTCPASSPELQEFAPLMESNLQNQGQSIKDQMPQGNFYPVLGYIEGLSAQKDYYYQNLLNDDPSYASYLLSVQSKGVIDCYRDGCNWQGVEYRQYDLRQQIVRDYYVQNVIGGLINGSGLDGSFIDVIDWWSGACAQWGCTPQETNDLVNGSLLALDQALYMAQFNGKVLSVSSHTNIGSNPEYYYQQCAILAKYGNGIRFWEFFDANEVYLQSLIYETQTMLLPTHVHVTERTLSPDWVELAVFLLGMGTNSYFSYSGPWMLDSFAVWPEYNKPLGPPLGPAINTTTSTPTTAWQLLSNLNLVYGWPNCPNATCDIVGKLAFMGVQNTPEDCLNTILATQNASFSAMSWVAATSDEWSHTCWGRLDTFDAGSCVNTPNDASPCYSYVQSGHVSAVRSVFDLVTNVWKRSFAHLDVVWTPSTGNATLNWH